MSAAESAVHCQLLPLRNEHLLLPSTVIAEVIRFGALEPMEGVPPWLLGRIAWRDRAIAVVSFEVACGEQIPAESRQTKIVVLSAPGDNAQLDFWGVVVQNMPQLLQVSEANLDMVEHETELHPLSYCHVIVNGKTAIIPNLSALEERLLASMPG
ncbi:MAG: chemotaxis protein CheW [Gammaproteobacteria bacterium]|nr:chemotaxis protein CheW [Gammaproteobacteria bacterium]